MSIYYKNVGNVVNINLILLLAELDRKFACCEITKMLPKLFPEEWENKVIHVKLLKMCVRLFSFTKVLFSNNAEHSKVIGEYHTYIFPLFITFKHILDIIYAIHLHTFYT